MTNPTSAPKCGHTKPVVPWCDDCSRAVKADLIKVIAKERNTKEPEPTNIPMIPPALDNPSPSQGLSDFAALAPTNNDELVEILKKYRIAKFTNTTPLQTDCDEFKQAIQALITQHTEKAVRESEPQIIDKWVAYLLENVYPLDVFSQDVKGDTAQQHTAGIYHGMHILRREVRQLSAREDLAFLPQETEEYYAQLKDGDINQPKQESRL